MKNNTGKRIFIDAETEECVCNNSNLTDCPLKKIKMILALNIDYML